MVIGGGAVAARKVALLLKAGAKVTVLSTQLNQTLAELWERQQIAFVQKAFSPTDVEGFQLVISATDQAAVNGEVARAAKRFNIPVNVVDCPKLCSFIFPAIIDRSPVVVAVSSGGASPVLARLLHGRLESLIPAAYGQLARLAERFRKKVKQTLQIPYQRRLFWEKTLQGSVAERVFAGREKEAEDALEQTLQAEAEGKTMLGEVYLVGAGPGDPDLLTFRALRLMQQADVVVYDRLVSPAVRELVRRDAEMIYAGKERDKHALPQEKINALLARLAQSGKRVVRLKGGDPFIFGRGGEEIETLMEQGIPFQVVPGITAASGCAAYAGIPLTHRDYAQSCVFVTGHRKDGGIDLDWKQLTLPQQTVVIYMGLLGLESICQKLIEHGSPPDLPAALIQQGTTQNQRVLTGTLQTLPAIVQQADVAPPTLVIVGEVVKLHKKLAWFVSPQSLQFPPGD